MGPDPFDIRDYFNAPLQKICYNQLIMTDFIPIIDLVALLFFVAMWFGYSLFADYDRGNTESLVKAMHRFRLQWAKSMIKREDRFVDLRLIGNLLKTTIFLASTSIFLIVGLVAVMGFANEAVKLSQVFMFMPETTPQMWIGKTMLLLVIFIYSFFKSTWVARQLNYASVLVLAAPKYYPEAKNLDEVKRESRYVHRITTMLSNASRHFNMAIRAYYFGLVALSWYINPLLLMFMSVLVVLVLYRREFMSRTLIMLS